MSTKHFLLPLLFLAASTAKAADIVTEYILDTVDSGEGQWPCLYYELNYNTDIALAEKARWYAPDEDESYWREGIGPFSIDANKFLVTQWQSTVHPILIRRHFTLTEEDLAKIEIGAVNLTYSYDENPTFWLNGTRLTSASGWNDDNYATFRLPVIRKKLLAEGDNVLCVSLQQGAGGGHIDFGLTVTYNATHTGIISSAPAAEEESIFDLQGRKVAHGNLKSSAGNKLSKGIYIANGKRIVL